MDLSLNLNVDHLRQQCVEAAPALRIGVHEGSAATILDFGVGVSGGLSAGLLLARLCMSDLATVALHPAAEINVPQLFVHTDHPVEACLLSQYAGWKVATDDYFAMASGPMRAAAKSEALFEEFETDEPSDSAVGILEAGGLPTESAVELMTKALSTECKLTLAVAPTASQAGNLQVVARSVETAMHKLHEIGFPVTSVVSGSGVAPLPPVAKNDLEGIGRTNDSILYGATVNLWVDCDESVIEEFGPQTPSKSSVSHGSKFLKLFKEANHDFYALDKSLFSPAVVVFHSLKTGRSFTFGETVPELLLESFGL